MASPNSQLTAIILSRLLQEKVLTQAYAEKLKANLENGKLKQEDWLSAIELSVEKEGGHGQGNA